MQRARVFVMASRRAGSGYVDGLPNVIAEAMACGAVVVATDFSGIPEIVDDGVTGLLVLPADVATLARALSRALRDDALCDSLRYGARERVVEMFDITRNVAPLADYFERVLGRSEGK
jgi:glycosyltransferase involved in cell wall biosynthesis